METLPTGRSLEGGRGWSDLLTSHVKNVGNVPLSVYPLLSHSVSKEQVCFSSPNNMQTSRHVQHELAGFASPLMCQI